MVKPLQGPWLPSLTVAIVLLEFPSVSVTSLRELSTGELSLTSRRWMVIVTGDDDFRVSSSPSSSRAKT